MSNLIVGQPIVVENPFGAIMHTLANDVLPFIQALAINKEKVAQLSNAELPDYVPVLKQYAPDLLTQDGKIDWNKVNEYATSGDVFKQKIANVLSTAKKYREEYAKQPIVVKLSTIDQVMTTTDPAILRKIGASNQALQKLINKMSDPNIPDEVRNIVLSNINTFVEKPEYVEVLDSIISGKKKQQTPQQQGGEQQQGGGTGSWRFSLDGSKPFGIELEEPQLDMNLPDRPNIGNKVARPTNDRTVKPVGGGEQPKQGKKVDNQKQPSKNQKAMITFWRDGVLWGMRKGENGKVEYVPLGEAPLVEQDTENPFNLIFGGFLSRLLSKSGGIAGKIFGRGGSKVAEKEAQEVAEKEAQDVVKQASKYDERRKQVAKRIKKQMEDTKGLRGEIVDYTPPQFEKVPVVKYTKQAREKKLPVVAPKETRWEFANAKPPATVFREGRIVDYTPPQFERITTTQLKELARQRKLPITKGETAIKPKPKETPYKETVAQQGFKTSRMLEEFLKETPPKVETKQSVLNPIKKMKNLIEEIPDEAKNDPEIRRRLVEITRDLKKISGETPFRDVSDDLKVLDAKVDELKDLLMKRYGKTTTEKTIPKQKKKKSNK